MSKLLIVEAPGKIKKLKSLVPPGFQVMASAGHIRDLPKREIGVEAPDFKPAYEVTKPDVVARLKSRAKSASEVILATDLDREGEAIAWHLADVLKLKNPKRVVYDTLSKSALQNALTSPRQIDMNLVRAQEGRRVLDRLIGYRVSSELRRLTGMPLSAGRVQIPATMILVEREREIRNFKPIDHFGVRAHFTTDGRSWHADWNFKPLLAKGESHWLDRGFAARVAELKKFRITKIESKETKRGPQAPFTTSTLQQAASSVLGMRPQKSMQVAQKLYEEGLITYHRTDSPNISLEAAEAIWQHLRDIGMENHASDSHNTWKAKNNAQEAHECIRPASIAVVNPENISPDAARLYNLIWCRAVASQMKPQVLDVTTVHLLSDEMVQGCGAQQQSFIGKGSVEKFDGWRSIYKAKEDEQQDQADQSLPQLTEGAGFTADNTELQSKQTKPPARFTEASLIKQLEAEGIGRPSTYAAIISTLHIREYVQLDKKKLAPTETAFRVVDTLAGKFSFADLPYTKQLEADLDMIVTGKMSYRDLLATANAKLDQEIKQLAGSGLGAEAHPCPKDGCDGTLQRRKGKNGWFWACSQYPECKESRPDTEGKPGERGKVQGDSRFPCPDCGTAMALREGRTGKFWACTAYPDCKTTLPNSRGKPVHFQCPECNRPLRKLKAKQGKHAGQWFWGCSGFADGCRFSTPDIKGKPKLES